MEEPTTNTLRRKLLSAGLMLLSIYSIGTVGYYLLGRGRWALGDCAYMTVISLTTVGYGETLDGLPEVPYARGFTASLLVLGAGIALYFVSVLTTFLVEGEFFQIQRRRRMRKQIKKMKDHIIICGVGRTGLHVLNEIVASGRPFVVIDTDHDRLQRCQEKHGQDLKVLVGDATDDNMLLEAGIKEAQGIVACLPNDQGNLYVVITARVLNPSLRIVAKAVEPMAVGKLLTAGADRVVSVNTIGGLRLASEMLRPNVVTFLDQMIHDRDKNLRFDEVTIPERSRLANLPLARSGLRAERNLLIVAAREAGSSQYTYSPGGDFMLKVGMTLIVLGETASVQRLRESPLFTGSQPATPRSTLKGS